MAEGSERDVIASIERGFAVLLAFDADLPAPSLAEVATKTGLSRPAVRRILLTLQKLGYVNASGSRWSLTPRVLTIGQHYAASHAISEVAQPHLLRLAELTHESASLSQLDGTGVVYVARVHVRRVMSLNVDIGSRVPVHATSMGRVLVAWADASVIEQVIEDGLPALTPTTVTDPVAFRDALHEVRQQGFALVDGELEPGFLSAAAPVRNPAGDVVAALAYSTSRGRTDVQHVLDDVVPHLLDVAASIQRDLAVVTTGRRTLAPGARDGFF
ncbi:IclR family transcriptional regulator domain-containing protein [Nocardioides currus]|uniref:IclR family transcriptional regulator n=1 Tax=Nocardioides currus TaxID=2133958 RepID=A0A2R7Z0W3_9ACTN|nr:IclR family transcriptional regulator C-terminal domain-containing protein [Nocardioides currus]PUA82267.1 IclR family transcriptional regulator [Nocardioides currus]